MGGGEAPLPGPSRVLKPIRGELGFVVEPTRYYPVKWFIVFLFIVSTDIPHYHRVIQPLPAVQSLCTTVVVWNALNERMCFLHHGPALQYSDAYDRHMVAMVAQPLQLPGFAHDFRWCWCHTCAPSSSPMSHAVRYCRLCGKTGDQSSFCLCVLFCFT